MKKTQIELQNQAKAVRNHSDKPKKVKNNYLSMLNGIGELLEDLADSISEFGGSGGEEVVELYEKLEFSNFGTNQNISPVVGVVEDYSRVKVTVIQEESEPSDPASVSLDCALRVYIDTTPMFGMMMEYVTRGTEVTASLNFSAGNMGLSQLQQVLNFDFEQVNTNAESLSFPVGNVMFNWGGTGVSGGTCRITVEYFE